MEITSTDPSPAALTQQDLSTILSNTNIHERAATAFEISHPLATVNCKDPGLITKAFEQFQICTHNIHSLQPQDASKKRRLFGLAQTALGILEDCILIRLDMTIADFLDVEREQRTVDSKRIKNIILPSMRANLRLTALHGVYKRILDLSSDDMSSSPLLQQAIRIALGEEVQYTFADGMPGAMWELWQSDIETEDDRKEWKQLMFAFAAGVLILTATAVYEKFGLQSVELFGTRVPVTPFQ